MRACQDCGRAIDPDAAFCPYCGAKQADAGPGLEHRKTVTVLFCDVTGSTALGESVDPEALRSLLARYFERMQGIVVRHGGSVEKFIGDAVMAVFGVPAAHEDDALRAIRAASEMREAVSELGIEVRIGVNTGEVVAGTEERLATGDAVNVAARLEQAAQPGEVLIGASTVALVGDAVEVEAVEPLALKGKAQPVPAYRLIAVRQAPERRSGTPFVGREHELTTLRTAWVRAQAEQRCELVTILGEAGIGKSRLVAEALALIDGTVVRGRCLPYGEGITYWPVVEVLKQLERLPPDEASAAPVRSLLGESTTATTAEEIAWAFRKTLEHAALERPVAVVFDDIQWGEETFLDLIEHVGLLSTGAPILLLCMARPEFAERRPAWMVTLRLEPLSDDNVKRLLPETIGGALRDKIARAASGNPLFIEEMVAVAGGTDGQVVVPPTLQALLTTRLDQLPSAERSVLERGAIEGEVFHRGVVQALSPAEIGVTPRLAALVRKELIRPDAAQLPGEDGFRFRHLLIRDAAYEGLPKATRAELHERFATWLQERGASLVELNEILGYHLSQAVRYRRELGLPVGDELQASARRRLAIAGRRAYTRQDFGAAVSLLQRAAALVPPDEFELVLEVELADALFWGDRADEALRHASAIAERAAALNDGIGELCGRIQEGFVRTFAEPEGATEQLDALVRKALPVFEAAGDDVALCLAYRALGQVANMRAQLDGAVDAYERAAAHAARAGLTDRFMVWRGVGRIMGSTRVSDVLAWQDAQDEGEMQPATLRALRAWALAMLGRPDEAKALFAEVHAELTEQGATMALATGDQVGIGVQVLAGDLAAAAALGEEGCRLLEDAGQQAILSTLGGYLARVYCELGRLEEADAWADKAERLGSSDDALTQMLWRRARAKVLGVRGERSAAERLAREAIAIGDRTEMLNEQADAYADLGEVLALAGRSPEAANAMKEALARYERKENVVMAARMRSRLAPGPRGVA